MPNNILRLLRSPRFWGWFTVLSFAAGVLMIGASLLPYHAAGSSPETPVLPRASVTPLPSATATNTRVPTSTPAPTSTRAVVPVATPTLAPTLAATPSTEDYVARRLEDIDARLAGHENPSEVLIEELRQLYYENDYVVTVEEGGSSYQYIKPEVITGPLYAPDFTALSGSTYWVFVGEEPKSQPFRGTAECRVISHVDIDYMTIRCQGYPAEITASLVVVPDGTIREWIAYELGVAYNRVFGP
jgi:hypothetical protein